MSLSEMSVIVYFLMTADMFSTASLAIVPSCPVATMVPFLDWEGATSATIGNTTPEYSAMLELAFMAARPFTAPTSAPSILNISYDLCDSM
jgi:hypothetical protein